MQYLAKAINKSTGETEYLKVNAESKEAVYPMLAEDGYVVESIKSVAESVPNQPSPPPLPPGPKDALSDLAAQTPRSRVQASTTYKHPVWLLCTQISIIVILTITVIILLVSVRKNPNASPVKWEYRIESPDDYEFDSEMARLGVEGWEMVFARRATSSISSPSYEMIFKRPERNANNR